MLTKMRLLPMEVIRNVVLFSGLSMPLLVGSCGYNQEPRDLTVCDVLNKLSYYRGNVITIKGNIDGGWMHGWALYDSGEFEVCPKLAKQWPAGIDLFWPSLGNDAVKQGLAKMKRLKDEKPDIKLSAVIKGELQARWFTRIYLKKEGNWFYGNGYGEGGQFPARLMVADIADIHVIEGRR